MTFGDFFRYIQDFELLPPQPVQLSAPPMQQPQQLRPPQFLPPQQLPLTQQPPQAQPTSPPPSPREVLRLQQHFSNLEEIRRLLYVYEYERTKHGFIYIFQDNHGYKVGCSSDPDRRIRELRTGNIHLSQVTRFRVTEKLEAERKAHEELFDTQGIVHLGLEWFNGPLDLIITTVFMLLIHGIFETVAY